MAKFTKYNNPNNRNVKQMSKREEFERYIKRVHNLTYGEYLMLNEFQKEALNIEWFERGRR